MIKFLCIDGPAKDQVIEGTFNSQTVEGKLYHKHTYAAKVQSNLIYKDVAMVGPPPPEMTLRDPEVSGDLTLPDRSYLLTLHKPGHSPPTLETHVLYENEDKNKPKAILDSNGEVTLGLCKLCNKGEQELIDHPICPVEA